LLCAGRPPPTPTRALHSVFRAPPGGSPPAEPASLPKVPGRPSQKGPPPIGRHTWHTQPGSLRIPAASDRHRRPMPRCPPDRSTADGFVRSRRIVPARRLRVKELSSAVTLIDPGPSGPWRTC